MFRQQMLRPITERVERMSFTLGQHVIDRYDANRTLLIDRNLIQFTPTEYRLVVPLLNGQAITDRELAWYALQAAYPHMGPERKAELDKWVKGNLEKHIDKIRGKLQAVSLDVHRIVRVGYILGESLDER